MTEPKIIRAVGYVRVSTDEQAKHGWNLGEDRRRIAEVAREKRWAFDGQIYDDGGRQGDDPDRPGLLAMLAGVDSFDVVIVRSQDRLTRDLGIWATITAALNEKGVAIETFTGPIETQTPQGELVGNIFAALGRFEKRQIGQRVKQASEARARQGLANGRAPYGYRSKGKGVLVMYDDEAAIVREIFERYVGGESQRSIARSLNAAGKRAQRSEWTQGTVRRVLNARVYIGKITLNGQVYDGAHAEDRIIDDATWGKAQALTAANSQTRRGRAPAGNHLLSGGMIVCVCGSPMWSSTVRQKGRDPREQYKCSRREKHGPEACDQVPIERESVDEAVWRFFEEVVLDAEATKALLADESDARAEQTRADLKRAERDVSTADRRLVRVRTDYQDELITARDWSAQRPDLESKLAVAQDRVHQLSAKLDADLRSARAVDAQIAAVLGLTRSEVILQVRTDAAKSTEALRGTLRRLFSGFELPTPTHPFGAAREHDGGMEHDDGIVWQGRETVQVVDSASNVTGLMLQPRLRAESLRIDGGSGDGFPSIDRATLPPPDTESRPLTST